MVPNFPLENCKSLDPDHNYVELDPFGIYPDITLGQVVDDAEFFLNSIFSMDFIHLSLFDAIKQNCQSDSSIVCEELDAVLLPFGVYKEQNRYFTPVAKFTRNDQSMYFYGDNTISIVPINRVFRFGHETVVH